MTHDLATELDDLLASRGEPGRILARLLALAADAWASGEDLYAEQLVRSSDALLDGLAVDFVREKEGRP